jgi:anti-sigma factor RsiW
MNQEPDRTNARAEARAELVCREVREDIVALQRDELSPLRAESIRRHLASCAECREEALGLELAVRDYANLPELVPSPDLIDVTMRRVSEESGVVERPRSPAPKAPAARSPRRAGPEPVPVEQGASILRRPVSNPFVRVAVAALLFLGVMILRNEKVVDAAGRAQRRLLGANVSEVVDEARDAFLAKLRL